ncbi:alpha-amylase [Streptomyces sp. H51]|uniref:alpha-amylase n=1 Tax=Streptomyces sp. H51 TaxID=3111770 RepID=UPI002D76C0C0|nr:alpha-amylase [Streptomyces sp. H51]
MQGWMNRSVATAGLATALILPSALRTPAAVAAVFSPAPSCVAMYQSRRYTDAANDCAGTQSVTVVYQDGAAGLCHTLEPGAFSTVGEGCLGPHGHADHLAVCEPS